MNLKIYMNRTKFSQSQTKLIYDQTLQCTKISIDGELDFVDKQSMHARLLLVHPIIYYLGQTNSYNKIVKDKTALDMLEGFNSFLKSNFGEIFDFNKIGDDVKQNKYIYDEILIKSANDLNVPSYLIHNYKINNSLSFYFYDNFYLKDTFKKEIVNHYINIFDFNKFLQVDVEEYTDMMGFTQFIKEIEVSDFNKDISDKGSQRIIFNERNIRMFHEKDPVTVDLPKKKPGGELESNYNETRNLSFEQDGSETTKTYDSSSRYSTIYCPDSSENGRERFNTARETMDDKIKSIDSYQFNYCLPDFPQFGEIYNLFEGNTIDDYLITPINIVNIFKRKSGKEPDLDHMSKSLFIHFQK